MSYGNTFDKVLDLLDQKYHFLDTFDTKTQKLVKKTNPKPLTQKQKLCCFNPKKCKWV